MVPKYQTCLEMDFQQIGVFNKCNVHLDIHVVDKLMLNQTN